MNSEARGVHIFWDTSNIFFSAKSVAIAKEGPGANLNVRVQFDRMIELAAKGRQIISAVAVGSIPPESQKVWENLKQQGVKVQLFERGQQSNREQAVDEALELSMLRAMADHDGGIAVLLTGDGAGFFDGVGFHADLERLHKKGWGIEVLAWETTCNRRMKEWVNKVGIFVPLEEHYHAVTFSETKDPVTLKHKALRRPKPLDLSKREALA